jgi:putative membrane protein
MTTDFVSLSDWSWSIPVLVSYLGLAAVYLLAFGRRCRFGWLAAATVMLMLTLDSPLNTLAEGYLFSAHMAQHILLLLIVPGLLLLAVPRGQSLAFLPRVVRHPILGWIAGVGAMWFWHVPAFCDAAVASNRVHAVQTISLVMLGLLFWLGILAPRESERFSPPLAVAYLFTACAACSVLGIVLTLSPITVCSAYVGQSAVRVGVDSLGRGGWSLDPAQDQQLGGLLMWVPMCFIYLLAIFAQVVRWFRNPIVEEMESA